MLGAVRRCNIYRPKSFDAKPGRQYPVLHFLHGLIDTNYEWIMHGHIQDVMNQLTASGEAQEMIAVTPDAGGHTREY